MYWLSLNLAKTSIYIPGSQEKFSKKQDNRQFEILMKNPRISHWIFARIINLCLVMSSDFKYSFGSADKEVFKLDHTIKSLAITDGSYSHGIISPKNNSWNSIFVQKWLAVLNYVWLCTYVILPLKRAWLFKKLCTYQAFKNSFHFTHNIYMQTCWENFIAVKKYQVISYFRLLWSFV